jgi:hypothetical protein
MLEWMASRPGGPGCHGLGHRGAPVAALGHIAAIAEAAMRVARPARSAWGPSRWWSAWPRTGGRGARDHHSKGIRRRPAVVGGVGEGPMSLSCSMIDPASRG